MPDRLFHLPHFCHPLAVACSVMILALPCCRKTSQDLAQSLDATGYSVVSDSMAKTVNPTALETMRWQDVAPTAESCANHQLTEEALNVSATITLPPVIYLRGLLKFSLNDVAGAAAEWDRLKLSDIPPDQLYAPWRLQSERLAADRPNRYAAPLAQAVKDGKTSPLVTARYQSIHHHWQESLEAYLQSDPANWSPFELKVFATMKLQAPIKRDVEVLMAGALAGDRVPPSLRAKLATLIKSTPAPDMTAFAAQLKADPTMAKAATESVKRALDLRRAFANHQFSEVVTMVQSTDPLSATDETALLAFLAAAKIKDQPTANRWAAEIIRRNPDSKTRQWISDIRNETR